MVPSAVVRLGEQGERDSSSRVKDVLYSPRGRRSMNPERRLEIEDRIHEISSELGLLEPTELTSGSVIRKLELQEIEELYAERESLLQELEKDC